MKYKKNDKWTEILKKWIFALSFVFVKMYLKKYKILDEMKIEKNCEKMLNL